MRARTIAVIALSGALALIFGATAIAKPQTVKSNFNTDIDNWGTVDNFDGLSILEDPGYTPTEGHPGGAIYADDDDSGPGENTMAFLAFGTRFTGNFSAYYGGKIKLDMLENESTSKKVRIEFGTGTSQGGKAFFAKVKPAPGTDWQSYSVPLTAAHWQYAHFGGMSLGPLKPATKRILKRSLHKLKVVEVVADYSHAAGETVTLDNYAWVPPKG